VLGEVCALRRRGQREDRHEKDPPHAPHHFTGAIAREA
jgi:hypothetical protein